MPRDIEFIDCLPYNNLENRKYKKAKTIEKDFVFIVEFKIDKE